MLTGNEKSFVICHGKVTGSFRMLLFFFSFFFFLPQQSLFSKGHNELFVLPNTEVKKKRIWATQFSNTGLQMYLPQRRLYSETVISALLSEGTGGRLAELRKSVG